MQITITSTKEKTQDIPADEKLETVIPDKEIVDADMNNTVTNIEVKIQQRQPLVNTFMMSELTNTRRRRNTRIIKDVSPFFEQMQETNKYVDLEDQQPAQPKETRKHKELQTTMTEEVRLQTLFL